MEYAVTKADMNSGATGKKVLSLLEEEGIAADPNLDYTCAAVDENGEIVGTGSAFRNTLRCFAVSGKHQGEGILNSIVTHLIEERQSRGMLHLFLYTKTKTAKFFESLAFSRIAEVPDKLVFMENRKGEFENYIARLKAESKSRGGGKSAAIVMNANPFTLGHRHLIDTALEKHGMLHLFIVSEDLSAVPFEIRKKLVLYGTADLKDRISYHDCGPYMISSATFPCYFLNGDSEVASVQSALDAKVFSKIANALGICERFVGTEKPGSVTAIYNETLKATLPQSGIALTEIPRKETNGAPISASTVRKLLKSGRLNELDGLVPPSTAKYFTKATCKEVFSK